MEEEDKSNIDTFFMPKNEVHETMLLIETKSIPKIITQWQFIDLTQKMRKMHNKNIYCAFFIYPLFVIEGLFPVPLIFES